MMLQTLHQCDAAPQNCSVCGRASATLLQGRSDTAVTFSSRARACPESPRVRGAHVTAQRRIHVLNFFLFYDYDAKAEG